MKQDEAEWVEYEKVMQDVIEKSGLNKDIFYDLRGNHDAFGVPSIGSLFDFFSKHSINGQLGRSGQVNSVTVQVSFSLECFYYYFLVYMRSWLLFEKRESDYTHNLWMSSHGWLWKIYRILFAITFHSASK